MNSLFASLSGVWIVFLAAACGSESNNPIAGNGGSGTGATGTGAAGTGAMGTGGHAEGVGGVAGGAPQGTGGAAGSGGVNGGGGVDGAGGEGSGAGGTGGGGSAECPVPMAPPAVDRPTLVVSGPGNFWQMATPMTSGGGSSVTVTDQEFQTWHGFGGTFNEAGWDALSVLTAEQRHHAIKLLFSPTEGANLAWGRIPMGASDYALERYTLNETPGDTEMNDFSIARDRMHLIPYIHAAQTIKSDIKFWGSPWTPPRWMKTVSEYNGTDRDAQGNNQTFQAYMKDDAATLQAHALYFARFVEEYEKECIPIDHVQPQNEPGYDTRYPSCLWDAGLLGTFVADYLGPTFESRGVDADIWFGTLSNDNVYSGHIGGLTGPAANYTTGVGLQWNTIDHVGQLASQGYLVMQTEHKCGNYPWNNTTATSAETADRNSFLPGMAPNNHNYGVETWDYIVDWLTAGVHIYSAWNMVLDTLGQNLDAVRPWPQNALLAVDRDQKQLIETPAYYVFRHLSYFIDPGAVRLGTQGGDALAFRNLDGNIVVVVFNSGQSAAQTTISVSGTMQTFEVPGRGWATLNFKG